MNFRIEASKEIVALINEIADKCGHEQAEEAKQDFYKILQSADINDPNHIQNAIHSIRDEYLSFEPANSEQKNTHWLTVVEAENNKSFSSDYYFPSRDAMMKLISERWPHGSDGVNVSLSAFEHVRFSDKNKIIDCSPIELPAPWDDMPRKKLYLEANDSRAREAIFQCKDSIKEIREPGNGGKNVKQFSFDRDANKWFTYSPTAFEKAKSIIAEILNTPAAALKKLYIEPIGKAEREAVFQCKDKIKAIRDNDERQFFFDKSARKWFTYSPSALETAKAIIEAKLNDPIFRMQTNFSDKEPHQKIPLETKHIPSDELRRQMKGKGCFFDGEQNLWVAPNNSIAREIQAIIDAAPKHAAVFAQEPETYAQRSLFDFMRNDGGTAHSADCGFGD
jgi:predicted transcriptional regulator